MKKKLALIIVPLILLSLSFNNYKISKKKNQANEFIIEKNKVGDIHIGMTINESRQYTNGLDEKIYGSNTFGVGGGNDVFYYSKEGEGLFTLFPSLSSDTIKIIQVFSNNYKTINGISPESTAKELLYIYPNLELNLNLMTMDEMFTDDVNGFTYVFMTEESDRVGNYVNYEDASKPINLNKKLDYIEIR